MSRFGFTGPSYTSQSPNLNAERCVNLYFEPDESGNAKSKGALYCSPGLKKFATLASPVRALLWFNNRFFAIGGPNFYELDKNGVVSNVNPVANDGGIAYLVGGAGAGVSGQILVISAGNAYVFALATNTWTILSAGVLTNVAMAKYSDGYFLALIKGTNTFQISNLLDATTWPGLQTNTVSVFPDNLIAMEVDHRELFVASQRNIVGYYNSGSQNIYDVIPGSFIEQGVAASFSPVKADNSVFWIVQDERGQAVAVRINGYTPQRISNFAVEFAWQGYATVADAIGYSFQDQGHTFIHWYFPTANKSWRYDISTGMWHEVASLNSKSGVLGAHFSQVHAFAFNKHLVGDWNSGNIYQMSISFLDDAGTAIERMRRGPEISLEKEFIHIDKFTLDLETGLGPMPPLRDGNDNPRDPQVALRWSKDSGHNWSNQYFVGCGQTGQYQTRAVWRRLGRARGFTFEISMSDPIPWRIIDAYYNDPEERLPHKFRRMA